MRRREPGAVAGYLRFCEDIAPMPSVVGEDGDGIDWPAG